MNSLTKLFYRSAALLFLLFSFQFIHFNATLAQESPTPQAETPKSNADAPSLPKSPQRFDSSLTSVTLALFWTLGLFVVLVFLVKFSSPLRFRSSSGAFKTVESGFIMRGKVELATISWRDKSILIARSGDSIVKLSEIESSAQETPGANLEK